MRRLFSAAVLSFVLAGLASGGPRDSQEKGMVKDPFPREGSVEWDVQIFEDSPAFELVKREVKPNKVTWVLENKRLLGTEITFGYQAAVYDEDGVMLHAIGIETAPEFMNLAKGERNRFTLHLPPQVKWKDVRKVVIKNGLYGG
ncbi:MAG TPA: hypothetical protein VIL46_14070 [Gemmataceae bacterium]